MNWKVSCSDLLNPRISRALLRENFRRFWPIPVLAFLFYFLSGPFLLLMNYSTLENMRYTIVNMLGNSHAAFVILHTLVPIISAVIVFRYLQQPGSVTTTHALPFSRSTLFNTGFLSGFLMSTLPVAANGVILFLIRQPVYTQYYEDSTLPWFAVVERHIEYAGGAYNVFTAGAVLQWFIFSLVTILFVYAITVFAGVVTGVSLLHFGFGGWFNFLVPLLWLCMIFYFDLFWFGFDDSGSIIDITLNMNPLLISLRGDGFTMKYIILFVVISVVMTLVSKWCYFNRPMERVGDALTFRFMQPVLNYLITFMSMTLFGLYFSQAFSDDTTFFGIVIGTILGFIIGRMIVTKTLLIFNKQALKSLIAYAMIASLLMCSLVFDVFGYEKRIPDTDDIKQVRFPLDNVFDDFTMTSFSYYEEDPVMIGYLTDIHREIIRHKSEIENDNLATKTYLNISYTLNNRWEMDRRYRLPYEYLYHSEAMRTWFNSPERREMLSHGYDTIDQINYVQIYDYPLSGNYSDEEWKMMQEKYDEYGDYGNLMLYPNVYDLDSLLDALIQDSMELNYAEALVDSPHLFDIEINFRPVNAKLSTSSNTTHISVNARMTNTLQWFRDRELCDPVQDIVDVTAAILVTPHVWDPSDEELVPGSAVYEADSVFTMEASTAEPISVPGYGKVDLSKLEKEPLSWDGDRVYRHEGYSDTLQPASLKQIRSELNGSYLITDPEDIRQILTWADTNGNLNRNLFKLEFLYKVNDTRLYYRFGNMQLPTGLLTMNECDFTCSSGLAGYMNSAFQ
ncbi:MAG: hypothetical protein IJ486_07460 [Firmicutes bacterium]|nr:hypothetical protein [Bacillota bacterium]